MGSLSVTWDEHYRAPFQPLMPGVTFVVTATIRRDRLTARRSTTTRRRSSSSRSRAKAACGRCPRDVAARSPRRARARARCSSPTKCRAGSGRTGHVPLQPDDRPRRRIWSRSARRSAAACRSARRWSQPQGRRAIGARRSRHDVRRQSARVPRGARVPRRARGRPAGAIGRVSATSASAAARAAARHAGTIADVRGAGLMAGLELDTRRDGSGRRRARARAARQSHRDHRDAAAAAVHRHGA